MIFNIIIIVVLLLFITYEFYIIYSHRNMTMYTLDKNNVYQWAAIHPPNIQCTKSDLPACVYTDEAMAISDCSKSSNCLGYWMRNGSWIKKPGNAYQLVDSLEFTEKEKNSDLLAKFYKKKI